MSDEKAIKDHLDAFSKIVIDQENMGAKVDEEDQVALVLNTLPKAYANFVDTIKYARQKSILRRSWWHWSQKQIESQSNSDVAEWVVARGRSDHRNSNND